MKAYTIQELIDKLSKIEDKSLEVYVRGDTYNVVPCQEIVDASGDGDMIILACHMEFDCNKVIADLMNTSRNFG